MIFRNIELNCCRSRSAIRFRSWTDYYRFPLQFQSVIYFKNLQKKFCWGCYCAWVLNVSNLGRCILRYLVNQCCPRYHTNITGIRIETSPHNISNHTQFSDYPRRKNSQHHGLGSKYFSYNKRLKDIRAL